MKKKPQNPAREAMGFYKNLPAVNRFEEVFSSGAYRTPPEDWQVVVTDIVNSTAAIDAGKYKEVNIAGSIPGMAIANLIKEMDFPFIFGGDGVTYLIPEEIKEDVAGVLAESRRMIREMFDLELRIGMISVGEILAAGQRLKVGKLRVSDKYDQALFDGNGIEYAERLIKGSERYHIDEETLGRRKADYSGFTCRWQDIPSHRGETVSILIRLREEESQERTWREINTTIDRIFGEQQDRHPLQRETMKMADSNRTVSAEARVFTRSKRGILYALALLSIRVQIVFVKLFVRLNLPVRIMNKNLNKVVEDNLESSDVRKFDGTLKMVLAGTKEQRRELEIYLETLYRRGLVFYGLHVSDRALMTCLIHAGSTREVHYVDAGDGGYALAARQMKAQSAEELDFRSPAEKTGSL